MDNNMELTEGEYICPYTKNIECIETCESRAMNRGCRDKDNCSAYKESKNMKLDKTDKSKIDIEQFYNE